MMPVWKDQIVWAAEGEGSPPAPTEPVATEPVATEPVATEPVAPTTSAEPPVPVAPKSTKDWKDDRIARLTAQKRETDAELARLKAQIADPTKVGLSEAEVEARAEAKAAQMAQVKEFNDKCNAAAEQGRKTFKDFDSKVASFRQLSGNDEAAFGMLVAATVEVGNSEVAAKIFHHLGSDLNEAARIMALPAVKMAVELAKLGAKDAEPLSTLPPPVKIVSGRGSTKVEIDPTDPTRAGELTTAEWMARRNAQVATRH